ncbi:hypothetical protein BASA60_010836 [Batrachochytrium salamandrivorans]|nr:hypothetical protein BASA60_010836 [Batrachochytrium salamandrivorans]
MDGDDDVCGSNGPLETDTGHCPPPFVPAEKIPWRGTLGLAAGCEHDADEHVASGIKTPSDQGIVPPAFQERWWRLEHFRYVDTLLRSKANDEDGDGDGDETRNPSDNNGDD